ncbi:MAG: DUF3987 domain-containing protein [Venatoribacter sp.]
MTTKEQLLSTSEPLWLIPEPLASEIIKPAPYPVDAFPPLMRDAIKAIVERRKCPTPVAAFCVLGAVSYLAQTRVDVVTPFGQMPVSQFMLALGDSGTGKTEAMKEAFKPLIKKEAKRKVAYQKEVNARKQETAGMKPKQLQDYLASNPASPNPITMILTGNSSPSRVDALLIHEVSSLFINTDEGGQFFSGHAMKSDHAAAFMGGYTKWWDSGEGEREVASSNQDPSGFAQNRRLSLFMLAQQGAVIQELRNNKLKQQGMYARFLFSATEYKDYEYSYTKEDLASLKKQDARLVSFWKRLEELDAMAIDYQVDAPLELNTRAINLAEEADDVFLYYLNHYRERINPIHFQSLDDVKEYARRSVQLGCRVAAIFAFFEGKNEIGISELTSAMKIVDHSLSEWLRLTNYATPSFATQEAINAVDWLLERIVKKGESRWLRFTADEWGKSGRNSSRKAKIRDAVFTILVEKNYLLDVSNGRGREFCVNTFLIDNGANSAESAEALISQGVQNTEDLRKSAKNVRINATSVENPQLSENLPRSESCMNADFPQNPHFPKNSKSEVWAGEMTI